MNFVAIYMRFSHEFTGFILVPIFAALVSANNDYALGQLLGIKIIHSSYSLIDTFFYASYALLSMDWIAFFAR